MRGELQLLRPLNCILASGAVVVSAFLVVGYDIANYIPELLFASLSVFLITGAGNALNDYSDLKIDKIVHPNRALPSEKITPRRALVIAFISIIISIICAWFVNTFCFLLALIAIISEVSYATFLHKVPIAKNIIISMLVGLLFLYGGGAVHQYIVLWPVALLAFFANFAREIVKDIDDKQGDERGNRKTIPIVYGIRKSNVLAIGIIAITIALSPLPYLLGTLGKFYLSYVLIADAVFFYSLIRVPNSTYAVNSLKVAMALALIAIFAGFIQ